MQSRRVFYQGKQALPLMLIYQEEPPPEALATFVLACWKFEAPANQIPGQIMLPPDGSFNLAAIPGEKTAAVVLVGPHAGPVAVDIGPNSYVRGIRLRPEAAGSLIAGPLDQWCGQITPVAQAVPELSTFFLSTFIVEIAFIALLYVLEPLFFSLPQPVDLVRRAVSEIEARKGDLRIDDLARSLGVSPRTLQRKFLAATGLPPKTYARIRRFLLAVAEYVLQKEPEAWGRIAADYGFADQAHFVRECLDLTGGTPTAFAGWMKRIDHVDVRP